MARFITTVIAFVGLAGLLVLAPLAGSSQAQSPSATLYIAHVDTHEDASVVPIRAVGGRPLTFEVRVREAGTEAKAGWQVRIALDACRFETPSAADVQFGDYMLPGTPIPVGPKIKLTGNRLLIDQGEFYLSGSTAAASGLLATITVTPKPRVSCPDPTSPAPDEITAEFDLAILAAPGGGPYDVVALPGRFIYFQPTFMPFTFGSSRAL